MCFLSLIPWVELGVSLNSGFSPNHPLELIGENPLFEKPIPYLGGNNPLFWGETPRRLTYNLKMVVWKMIFLFQGCILRFHVNLPGCILFWVWFLELSWKLVRQLTFLLLLGLRLGHRLPWDLWRRRVVPALLPASTWGGHKQPGWRVEPWKNQQKHVELVAIDLYQWHYMAIIKKWYY